MALFSQGLEESPDCCPELMFVLVCGGIRRQVEVNSVQQKP